MDPQPSPSQLIHPLRYFLHHHGLHLRWSGNPGERGECGDAFKASSSGPRSTQELVWALPVALQAPLTEQLPTALLLVATSHRENLDLAQAQGRWLLTLKCPAHSFPKTVPYPGHSSPGTQRAGCVFLKSLQVLP